MIVKMKRLTLLCMELDRDAAVEALRDVGVVHVTDVRPPEGQELDALRGRLTDARRALDALPQVKASARGSGDGGDAERLAADLVAEVLELKERRQTLAGCGDELRHELGRLEPFGEFDLDTVRELANAGITTALGAAPPRETLVAAEDVVLTLLRRDPDGQYFSLVADGGWDEPPDLGAHYNLVPWPERPLSELREELADARTEEERLAGRLEELAAGRVVVADYAADLGDAVRVAEVRGGMGDDDELAFLSGYVPADDREKLRGAAAEHGWGVVFDDPQPGEDVPVLLKQSRFVQPVQAIFAFLHISPGYWEWDVGWVFLPFFSLFFAMIVGDAGYGTLLLVLTAVLQWRFKKVPSHVFHMMYIVGGATLFWGVITGSYFGIPTLPAFLEALVVPWFQERDNVIDLCFLIGAVHLSFAHVWNAVSYVRERMFTKVLAQIGWLMFVWSMFFLARQAVLGRSMPEALLYVLAVAMILIAVFMKTPKEFKTEWIDHAMLPLTFIGSFVDILSYIRLFAVGYASVAVLAAFNDMAASIGFDNVFTAVAASLLLLFANALNIVLAGLGVLVHAVRLNTLEFSTHKGLAWQGYNQYTPFAKRRKAA